MPRGLRVYRYLGRGGAVMMVVSTLALSSQAQSESSIYGKIFMSIGVTTSSSTLSSPLLAINSHSSRLGAKGKVFVVPENKDFYAVWQLEYGVNPDGDKEEFKQRNSYIGLQKSGWGRAFVGTHDTPLKEAQGEVDVFNAQQADIGEVIEGENREDNVAGYRSPLLENGLSFAADIALTEGTGDQYGYSASVHYQPSKDLFLAFATDIEINGWDLSRFVGTFQVSSDLTLGALFQTGKTVDSSRDQTGTIFSLKYRQRDWDYRAQLATAETNSAKNKHLEGAEYQLAFGASRYLADGTTRILGLATIRSNENTDSEVINVAAGIELKF